MGIICNKRGILLPDYPRYIVESQWDEHVSVDTVPGAAEAPEQEEDSEGGDERGQGEDQEHEGHHVYRVVKFYVL